MLSVNSPISAFADVGGWNGMMTRYPLAAANYTLANQTFYKCGMPREDWTHIFRDPTDGDIPWPGAVFGLTTLGLFTWCQDQVIIYVRTFVPSITKNTPIQIYRNFASNN